MLTRMLVALSLLALAACDGGDSGSPTSSSSSTTTLFDREAEERAVIDGYLAELEAFYAAANPPNPDHPRLAETATGTELRDVQAFLTDLRDRGIGVRKGEATVNHPRLVRISRTTAVIEDCAVDADVQFELATGRVVDDSSSAGRVTARLIKERDTWKVERTTVEKLAEPCE